MKNQTPLIKILNENREKILNAEKYNDKELESFFESLAQAEIQKQTILQRIKELGKINIEKLEKELEISIQALKLNIEYLKELGLLKEVGEKSRFFQEILERNEIEGLFPNVRIIRDVNLCCGCGLCVSICPVNAIEYLDDTFKINEDLCFECGLCFACCPRSFFPKSLKNKIEDNDSEVKFLDQLNYYREICTAQTNDDNIKEVAQDGGIVTTLLKTAFQEKLIDSVLTVGVTDKPHKPLPLYIENENDLLQTAGTKYANCPSFKIMHQSKSYNRIAVVGTPCMMQALKKISFYPMNEPYYDNIQFKIGLFCMESFDYNQIVELLENEFQKFPNEVKKMDIDKGKFYLFNKDGNSLNIPLKKIKKYGRLGCFFCGDLTAEHADISVGSIGSDSGWSTVIIRTKKGAELFQKAVDHNLIKKKEIKEGNKNFGSLSRIAKSKQKFYIEGQRPKMIEQDPKERITNFNEVSLGLKEEMVKLETQRCLQCGKPLCIEGCPVNINIPEFIRLLRIGKIQDALHTIKKDNLLPAICGRVCPQEVQCEKVCLLNNLGEPIAIGYLERYLADWERKNQLKECPDCQVPNNIKVAIIGSGPSGLTCAGDLAMMGYDVTIFEAFHAGGGVLVYGIPEFRLPKKIVADEIETLKMLGVKVEYNKIIGKILTINDLKEMGFKAFFIGVGAGLPSIRKLPGINLNGVLTANEFLTRANLMKAYKFPEYDTPIKIGKIIAVIGGGNTALDSARVALRLGAENVIIVYRRTEAEMPARKEEYHHAVEEGIKFQFLSNPVRFLGDDKGDVNQIEVLKMKLGEPDDSGRPRPIPIKNSEYLINCDTVIVAIGANANPILTKSIPELKITKWGYIDADENGLTNLEGIFAGGDIVTGSATVISAMGAGRKAATAINLYFK